MTIHAQEPKTPISYHVSVVDWRGRPAPGSTVALTVTRRTAKVTTTLLRQEFKVTSADGSVELVGPVGFWRLSAYRIGLRRGQPSIERSTLQYEVAPEWEVHSENSPSAPLLLKLRLAEWVNKNECATLWIDPTTSTQGQTYQMNKIRPIPLP